MAFCSNHVFLINSGQVSEWFKEHAWKACVREIVPWVRIPPCPPFLYLKWIKKVILIGNSNSYQLLCRIVFGQGSGKDAPFCQADISSSVQSASSNAN